jgi:primosomal protein N' (replication factor Y)
LRDIGYGTEKIQAAIEAVFPNARTSRMDLDTTRSRAAYEQIIRKFQAGETDILIGTQMLTKGLDFDRVSVVGIINADQLTNMPDFRAHERAFQMLSQVAGRAGRHNDRGRVVIQTSQPKHPVISYVASGDYHAMALKELEERRTYGYPPYSHLVRIMLRHSDYDLLRHGAHHYATLLRKKFGTRVMGPVSSALEMLRGEHRAEIIVKIESGASMQRARRMIREAIAEGEKMQKYNSIKLSIDVDA